MSPVDDAFAGYRTHTIDIASPDDDLVAVPAARGVLTFEDAEGRAILVVAAADLRRAARSRMAAAATPRADLRAITRRIVMITTDSVFETDLLFLTTARLLLPSIYKAAAERWRGWFLRVDPDEEHPRFVKQSTQSLESEGGELLGPVSDKHAAGKLIDRLIDVFDLCRYHSVLVQAPSGTACAYKEMGRCPAACDGSETLESYRGRVREAIECCRDGPEATREAWRKRMTHAAAALEFERAEHLRRKIDDAAGLTHGSLRWLGVLESMRLLCITHGGAKDWARVHLVLPGQVLPLADVRVDTTHGVLDALVARAAVQADRSPAFAATPEQCDVLGLVSAHLYASGRHARAHTFVRLADAPDMADDLAAALRGVLKRETDSSDVPESSDHAVGEL
jgi:excinuclease UvrABC nuclease subunit